LRPKLVAWFPDSELTRGSSVWRYGTSPPSDTQLLPMRECLHEDSRDVFAC